MATIRRRVAAKIARMTPDQARAKLQEAQDWAKPFKTGNVVGARIGAPAIKELTGGYSSQSIDTHVFRALAIHAGIIKEAK